MSTPTPLHTIFSWFEEGDMPTEYQFKQTFSSFRHLDDKIRMSDVTGLNEAVTAAFASHLADQNAHHSVLAALNASNLTAANVEEWKKKLKIHVTATVDGEQETGNVYTKDQIREILNVFQIKDDEFVTDIARISAMLISNDVNLNELQKIVDYIKENRQQIELLKEIGIGNSSDDKINLVGSYSDWNSVIFQNQFNDLVYDKIKKIEETASSEKIRHEERVRGDSRIKHDLDTLSFVIDAYDTVTMFTMPLKVRRIDTNTIDVLFDSLPPNMIQLTIKKI
ncbi:MULTISPECIES: hypothetical protein [Chryseobacterium]|uniref:Uncharacterized protein n=1 Tax=Chryseobacterium taihuense TaxID=1141221 RepID=A0A4U8WEB9_9FLAO|nr:MULTISPECIES: hypothetical protein [Chryseobacterium]QQV03427.1 hypothetical protein I6I61_03510 [Chryseobacterium sp. FDAARGOS 1104]VFB03255.1 Uncharacterised protein [Chryseobacterium taihuense]